MLNTKGNKKFYVRNDVMTIVINGAGLKKKWGERNINGFRKTLMIPESEISECPEFEVK